jgi:hypothetical protein
LLKTGKGFSWVYGKGKSQTSKAPCVCLDRQFIVIEIPRAGITESLARAIDLICPFNPDRIPSRNDLNLLKPIIERNAIPS